MRVERLPQVVHRLQIIRREHLLHEMDLLDADAVFARHAAAAGQTRFEDFIARVQHAFDLLGMAFIEEQDRMDVAVARVEDVDDLDIVLRADLGDLPLNERQLRARYDAILRAVARAEPADRAERLLAAFPELEPLFLILRETYFTGFALFAEFDDLIALLIKARFETVDFN